MVVRLGQNGGPSSRVWQHQLPIAGFFLREGDSGHVFRARPLACVVVGGVVWVWGRLCGPTRYIFVVHWCVMLCVAGVYEGVGSRCGGSVVLGWASTLVRFMCCASALFCAPGLGLSCLSRCPCVGFACSRVLYPLPLVPPFYLLCCPVLSLAAPFP